MVSNILSQHCRSFLCCQLREFPRKILAFRKASNLKKLIEYIKKICTFQRNRKSFSPKMAYPQLKTIHQVPEMMKGHANLGTPNKGTLCSLSAKSMAVEPSEVLSSEDVLHTLSVWLLSGLSSGKKGVTKKVATKNPTPINECRAEKYVDIVLLDLHLSRVQSTL